MACLILFVCTGNIFRSMVAEYALRAQIGPQPRYLVESAGIEVTPQTIHPVIRARLLQKGADPSAHVPRALTEELVERIDLIIAMGQDHREFIQQRFGRTAPLFNDVSFGENIPIHDLREVLPDWKQDLNRARDYVESVVDHIWDATPALIERLPHFL